jgi:alpha,alpha-trehalase
VARTSPGSLIWRNRWVTSSGIIECREALAFPGEPGRAVILRRIIALEGQARVHVVCDPRPGFGACRPSFNDAWEADGRGLYFRWSGASGARRADGLELDLAVPAGEHHDLLLEISERPLRDGPPDAADAWRATEDAWRCEVPKPHTIADRDAQQAYAVMRGMTSSTGGMVAAATTSGSGTTIGHSGRPKARSSSAISLSRWPPTSRATGRRRFAGSSATGPPAGRQGC